MGERFQTVAAMACMKSLLMIFNLAFWASGLAILCAGIWMQVELHRYLELSADFSNAAPYVLVGTGALILFIGTMACCCTVKGQSALLYMYGGFLTVVLILELAIAASIYAYKDRLADGFDRGLNQSLHNYGPNSVIKSADFDIMQSRLQCCGNHGYKDWNTLVPPRPIPRSCCRKPHCDTQDEAQIFNQGCYTKVVDFLSSNFTVIASASLGVALFPLIGALLSCCLASNINKAKYEQMA
uniref:Tetraspanin n=1 Tax=Corethrella appendiculata TaxID=1370023 RepID=U5EVC2_9DIPT